MSAAKLFRVRAKIVKRGWVLCEAFDAVRGEYITQLQGAVTGGGKSKRWVLTRVLPSDALVRAGREREYDLWNHHYDVMIREAEQQILAAQGRLLEGADEDEHAQDRPNETSPDSERVASASPSD